MCNCKKTNSTNSRASIIRKSSPSKPTTSSRTSTTSAGRKIIRRILH